MRARSRILQKLWADFLPCALCFRAFFTPSINTIASSEFTV
jgi:hypothetical protein